MSHGCSIPCSAPSGVPSPPPVLTREVLAYRAESLDLTLTDSTGQAYHLGIQRETALYSATYDRRGSLPAAPERRSPSALATGGLRELGRELRQELKELKHELRDLSREARRGGLGEATTEFLETLRGLRATVKGFQRLLHRFLQANDPGYAGRHRGRRPVEAPAPASSTVHLEVLAVSRTVTLRSMPADPEAWTVENTAARLRGYAVDRYAGGDRAAHAQNMVAAMERGYGEAEAAYGDVLPATAQETLDLARELLNAWQEEGQEPSIESPPESGKLDLVA